MLLNEFLKQHQAFAQQATTIDEMKRQLAAQQKAITTLTATLREQIAEVKNAPEPEAVTGL